MRARLTLGLLLGVSVLFAQSTPEELLAAGHFKKLRALAAARTGDDAESLYLRATVQQLWNNLDEAEKLAERAVAANPKDPRYHHRLATVAGIKAQRASVLRQMGLARKFKKEADATLALDPNHVRALDMMLSFYWEAPGIVGGDKAKARGIADHLMKIDPVEGYQAQITLARYEKQEGRTEEFLRKAVETRPASYEAHMSLGAWCASHEKLDEAAVHAREAIRLHADRAPAYGLLAVVFVHQDKWAELDATLAQSEKADPDNLVPYYRAAGNCLSRKKELPRAERYLRKYLSQEPEAMAPDFANTHWRLALVLEQQGRKPEAIAELQTALKLDPNSQAKVDLKRLK